MKFCDLYGGGFQVVLSDPPWLYSNWKDKAHGSSKPHYQSMTDDEIIHLPVNRITGENAALFLWITWPMLATGIHVDIMESWGFRPVTCGLTWNKVYRSGAPYCGLGFYTRSGSEPCLLGIKGRMPRKSRSVYQTITAPVGKHSVKPVEQYSRIESLFDGPYVELFSRAEREGWSSWGK